MIYIVLLTTCWFICSVLHDLHAIYIISHSCNHIPLLADHWL